MLLLLLFHVFCFMPNNYSNNIHSSECTESSKTVAEFSFHSCIDDVTKSLLLLRRSKCLMQDPISSGSSFSIEISLKQNTN
jgi:hypothetical protein